MLGICRMVPSAATIVYLFKHVLVWLHSLISWYSRRTSHSTFISSWWALLLSALPSFFLCHHVSTKLIHFWHFPSDLLKQLDSPEGTLVPILWQFRYASRVWVCGCESIGWVDRSCTVNVIEVVFADHLKSIFLPDCLFFEGGELIVPVSENTELFLHIYSITIANLP